MGTIQLSLMMSLGVGLTSTALAETRHVATDGNDTSAGTEAAPWRTLQHAADRVAPGETVVVHAGTYAGFVIDRSGTQAQPIAFVGQGAVTVDGALGSNRDAIAIAGGAWIRIEGLTIVRAARAGIAALDCANITVRNNKVDQNGRWGVFSGFCDDLVVEGNELSRSGTEHGVYASNSADRPVIRGNRIWGNAMCGVHLNGDISVGGGDGIISGAIVEDNIILDNGRLGGSGINGDGIVGATIRNNVLDGNHASGISLYAIDGGAPSTGNRVVNNTIRMASDGRWAVNIQDGSTDNILRNNILLHLSATRGAVDLCATCVSNMQSDNNAVTGRFSLGGNVIDLATWRTRTGNDSASFAAADELFTDAAGGDLTLGAGSPAIDRGVAGDAPAVDVLGVARPQGAAIDLGAYERCATAACTSDPGSGSGSGSGAGSGSGSGSGSDAPAGDHGGSESDNDDITPDVQGGCSGSGGGASAVLALLGLARLRRRRARRT